MKYGSGGVMACVAWRWVVTRWCRAGVVVDDGWCGDIDGDEGGGDCDSRTGKTSDGSEVKAKDEIIASTWNLVNKNLTSAEFSSLNDIVPSTVDTKYTVELAARKIIGDDTII
ncbi:hypothetical protein Tco_1405465 [Tanacetum coccineum]